MNPTRGILLKLAATALFVALGASVKAVSDHVPPGQAVFFRAFFALPFLLGWLIYEGRLRTALKTNNFWGQLGRGVVGAAAMGLNFAALARLSLPDVTAILYAAPILTVILAAVFLGEAVRLFRIAAVSVGLIGVLIVLWPQLSASGSVQPDSDARALGALFALVAACCMATAKILVRKLVATEAPSTVVLYATFTFMVVALFTLPFGWVMPTGREWLLLACAGFAGGLGQLLLTTAYTHADASTIAPFDYSSMIYALLVGYFIFGDLPTVQTLVGASIVVLAGLTIIWREAYLGKLRAAARVATPYGG